MKAAGAWKEWLCLGGGPLLGTTIYLLGPSGPQEPMWATAGVVVWMAWWWVTEAVPLAVTALLPLVLLPLWKVQPAAQVAPSYASNSIFLFLGGFLLALAVERSGLHRRIALRILWALGDRPHHVVLGFLAASAALSMWLSNTATTMMLLPIALSVLARAEEPSAGLSSEQAEAPSGDRGQLAPALLLAVAYGASLGGIATKVGTPPNVAFLAFYQQRWPQGPEISFPGWMLMALPITLLLGGATWWLLTRGVFRVSRQSLWGGRAVVAGFYRQLGPMTADEKWAGLLFLATAALWVLREPVRGWGWAPALGLGHGSAPGNTAWVSDATVAMLMGVLGFCVPSCQPGRKRLLQWSDTRELPWGVLLLFGGGLALASAMRTTGLAQLLGHQVAAVLPHRWPTLSVALLTTGMTALTELTSNLASVQMWLPILAETAEDLAIDPRWLLIPVTLAASCAFMLPVATPPNAIVYGSQRVSLRQMMRAGLWVNVAAVAIITLVFRLLGAWHLGLEIHRLPDWAG